jgi:hypothetical protein
MKPSSRKQNMVDLPPVPETETAEPVSGFPIRFTYQTGDWRDIFNKHVDLIQLDIRRALFDHRLVVYLSCPISTFAGSFSRTNVEVAAFTEQRLRTEWGAGFWFLNPSLYQMESQHGLGLIREHARTLELENPSCKIDVDRLMSPAFTAKGGDYMRMWTRVLVEDDRDGGVHLGRRFAAFYFLGAEDVQKFFRQNGESSLTTGIHEYFARKLATDMDFRTNFLGPFTAPDGTPVTGDAVVAEADKRRNEFFRYYGVRASVNYSRGSHDEWNIWQMLNAERRKRLNLGEQIAGFFAGEQIPPAATEFPVSPGYAIV